MPQNWEQYIQKLQSILHRSKQIFFESKKKITDAIKITAYWSAVLVVGLGIAGTILQVSGVPLVQATQALSGGWGGVVFLLTVNLLYYVIIAPISIFAMLISFLLDIVIEYPYGAFWSDSSAGGFVNVSAVQTGWRIVRDICNMFFALALVIIALATVLKIESYSWKQMLPKLVLNAVLINFSKSIAGIFTDFATVAMATFGGSFAGGIGKAMLTGFGMTGKVVGVTPVENTDGTTDSGLMTLILAFIAAAVMVVVFSVVALVFLVTLIFRILMLWFLIVLSPLAYVTRILPQTEKYSHQWWEMFGRYVVVGPLVTFFLWLSMQIAFDKTAQASPFSDESLNKLKQNEVLVQKGLSTPPPQAGEATSPNRLASFTIGIMMLLASLKLISQMAAEAGTITHTVEAAAMAGGLRLFEKSGQFLGYKASKWGVGPPAEGEQDTRTRGQRYLYQLGNVGAFLGSTIMQPVSWSKKLAHNVAEMSELNQQRMRGDATMRLASIRGESILGRGLLGGIAGSWNNFSGVLGGAGMEDGGHIFEKYISFEGMKRMVNRASRWAEHWDDMKRDAEGKTALDHHVDHAEDEENDAKKRLTGEELKTNATAYDRLVEAIEKLSSEIGLVNTNDPSASVNMALSFMATAAQEQIDRLDADAKAAAELGDATTAKQRNKQKNELEQALKSGKSFTLGTFLSKFAGDEQQDGLRKRVEEQMNTQKKRLEAEQKEIQDRLSATGVEASDYNSDGTLDIYNSDGTLKTNLNLSSEAQRNEAKKHAKAVDHHRAHVLGELGALEAGMSYDARKYKQKLVSEEMEKLRDIKNTDELMVYFNSAIDEKNQQMIEALLKQITQHGDDNEIFQDWLAGHENDPEVRRIMDVTATVDEHGVQHPGLQPSSGRDGGELFRKAILQAKLGMTTDESIRVMNDVAYSMEEGRHNGMGRLYGSSAGRWQIKTREQQTASQQAENRKKSIGDIMKGNRLYWGDEIGGERELRISESGWNELLSRGDAIGATRNWEKWDANTKLRLSEPKITRQMDEKGINPELIRKLKQYWVTTGQYVEAADWQKSNVIRKFA